MKLNKIPNFFIIGAAKSGTTTLYNCLSQHPDIFLPKVKEPRYFCYDEFKHVYYYKFPMIKTWEKYLTLYNDVNEEKAIGDGSVHYLYFPNTANNIKDKIGHAKIIASLRMPTERAFSHYLMDLGTGFVSGEFENFLYKNANDAFTYWHYLQYIELGLYYDQLKRYIDIFGRDNVKVILFDDLISNLSITLKEIFNFLDVSAEQNIDTNIYGRPFRIPKGKYFQKIYHLWFKNYHIRMFLKNILPDKIKTFLYYRLFHYNKPRMRNSTLQYLNNFYRKDIENLNQLLDIDLNRWLNIPNAGYARNPNKHLDGEMPRLV